MQFLNSKIDPRRKRSFDEFKHRDNDDDDDDDDNDNNDSEDGNHNNNNNNKEQKNLVKKTAKQKKQDSLAIVPVGNKKSKKNNPVPPVPVKNTNTNANGLASMEAFRNKISAQIKAKTIPNLANDKHVDISRLDLAHKILNSILEEDTTNTAVSVETRQLISRNIAEIAGKEVTEDIAPLGGINSTGNTKRLMAVNKVMYHVIADLMRKYEDKEEKKTATTTEEATADMISRLNIPSDVRAHHDSQLRSPRANERECAGGDQCECYLDPEYRFKMKEYLTDEEEQEFKETNATKTDHGLCLYCLRELDTNMFAIAVIMKLRVNDKFSCQSHRIFVDIPGEYDIRDCLPPGVVSVYPQILNTKQNYRHYVADGIHYLAQDGLRRIKADENPNSTAAATKQGFQQGGLQ